MKRTIWLVSLWLVSVSAVAALGAPETGSTLKASVVDVYGRSVGACKLSVRSERQDEGAPVVVGATDANGQVQMALPFVISTSREASILAYSDLGCGVIKTKTDTATVVLRPWSSVSGKVVDTAGAPTPGATVTIASVLVPDSDEDYVEWLPAPAPQPTAKTDDKGQFTLTGVPQTSITVQVAHSNFINNYETADARGGEPITIKMEPSCTVSGTVKRADGSAASGVPVVACTEGHEAQLTRTVTDDQGHYRLGGLPSLNKMNSGVEIVVGNATQPEVARSRTLPGLSPGHELQGFDFQMEKAAPVKVTVVNSKTHEPISGIAVLGDANGGLLDSTKPPVTAADGTATVYSLDGDCFLYAQDKGAWIGIDSSSANVKVKAGQPAEAKLQLAPGRFVVGVLSDGTKPLAGQEILVNSEEGEQSFNANDTTDAQGHFALGPWPFGVGMHYTVNSPKGFRRGEGQLTAAQVDAMKELTIPVAVLVTVTGRVLDAKGEPVADALVDVSAGHEEGQSIGGDQVSTDKDGVYKFPELLAGLPYKVDVTAHGYSSASMNEIAETANGDCRMKDVVLRALDGQISGRVLDAEGQPVVGATVLARNMSNVNAKSGPGGFFVLNDLPGGLRRVLAITANGQVGETQADAGSITEVRTRLVPLATPEQRVEQAIEFAKLTLTKTVPGSKIMDRECAMRVLAMLDPSELLVTLTGMQGAKEDDALHELSTGLRALAAAAPDQAAAHLNLLAPLKDELADTTRLWMGLAMADTQAEAAAKLLAVPAEEQDSIGNQLLRRVLEARLGKGPIDAVKALLKQPEPAGDEPFDITDSINMVEIIPYVAAQPELLAALVDGVPAKYKPIMEITIAGLTAAKDPAAAAAKINEQLNSVVFEMNWNGRIQLEVAIADVIRQLTAKDAAAAQKFVAGLPDGWKTTAYTELAGALQANKADHAAVVDALQRGVDACGDDFDEQGMWLLATGQLAPELGQKWLKTRRTDADPDALPEELLPGMAFIDPVNAWLKANDAISYDAGAADVEPVDNAGGAVLALAFLDAKSLATYDRVSPGAFGVVAQVLATGCWRDKYGVLLSTQPLTVPMLYHLRNCFE